VHLYIYTKIHWDRAKIHQSYVIFSFRLLGGSTIFGSRSFSLSGNGKKIFQSYRACKCWYGLQPKYHL